MRAILINPYDKTITETNAVEDYSLDEMYYALTPSGGRAVEDINSVSLNQSHSEVLWVDGEGLLFPDVPVWFLSNYPSPLAGIGLVLGCTRAGDNTSTRLSISDFLGLQGVKWSPLFTTGKLSPPTSSGNTITMGSPILEEKK